MKIIFLCGSLEPGRDGVGDYTRRLAGELIRQGYQVAAIALNDFHIAQQYNGIQDAEEVNLPIYRLPATWSVKKRFFLAKQFVDSFNPEWLSLQFVPFAFHHKGLPFSLPKYLSELGKGRQWHIMFHELWVGMARNSSKKLFIWGLIQKQLIGYIISNITPKVIHSHTQLYVEQIIRMGFRATKLPIFSNIPVLSQTDYPINAEKKISDSKIISFVIFGTVHSGAPIKEFSKEVFLYSKFKNVEIKLVTIGRSGAEQLCWVQQWKAAGLKVEELGEQPPQKISHVLRHASIGITSNPIFLVEKSGTIAAMREHGLPILCVSPVWFPRVPINLTPIPGISEYNPGNLEGYLNSKLTNAYSTNLLDIANTFLNSLLEENFTVKIA